MFGRTKPSEDPELVHLLDVMAGKLLAAEAEIAALKVRLDTPATTVAAPVNALVGMYL